MNQMKLHGKKRSYLTVPVALLQLAMTMLLIWASVSTARQYHLTVTDNSTHLALTIFATTNGVSPKFYVTNYLAVNSSMTNQLNFQIAPDDKLSNVSWDFGGAMTTNAVTGTNVMMTLKSPLITNVTPVTITSSRTDSNGAVCSTSKHQVVLLLPVQITIQKQGASAPPTNGVLVKNGDVVQMALNPGLLNGTIPLTSYPLQTSQVNWQYRQLNGDGTFGSWTNFQGTPEGPEYNCTTSISGIFQIQAIITVNGASVTWQYNRLQDDPYGADSTGAYNPIYRKGQPDYLGVVDNQWQIDVRNQAEAQLGSTNWAEASSLLIYPNGPTAAATYDKCNIFVYQMCNATGDAPVPLSRFHASSPTSPNYAFLYYPPWAVDWYDPSNGTWLVSPEPIPGWTSLGQPSSPQPGEVISRPQIGLFGQITGGHTGIVDYDGAWINAGTVTVNRNPNITPSSAVGNSYQPEHCTTY